MSEAIKVDISLVIGATPMPIGQLLSMDPGTIVDLGAGAGNPVAIYADDELVAHGEIVRRGDRIGVSVTKRVGRSKPVPPPVHTKPPAWMKLPAY